MDETKKPRVRDLFVWQSLSHPTMSYPKEVFMALGGLVILLTTVLVLFQEWLAICVTWAAYFLFIVLSKVPQVTVEHKITTEGIITLGHTYLWMVLGPFWFDKRGDETILYISGRGFLSRLVILIEEKNKEKVREILAEYLPYIEVPEKSGWDRLTDWFTQRFSKKTGAPGQN